MDSTPVIKVEREIIHTDAGHYFDSIIADIHKAKESIAFEVYIFEPDAVGERVLQALTAAARRGVDVRLLVDGMGAHSLFPEWSNSLPSNGGQVKIYHPLPWYLTHWQLAVSPTSGLRKLWFLIKFLNRRNHRKTIIIDQDKVWLGSFNICQNHLPTNLGGQNWRDTAIEIFNSDISSLLYAFNYTWNGWSSIKPGISKNLKSRQFRLNFTRKLRREHNRETLKRIGKARSRIWITNAYFTPDRKLLRALQIAATRGIDVRIILPHESDVIFMPWAASYFYNQLLCFGVRIFEYQAGILHSKTILIDDGASIGSSNLNGRSLLHDLENDYILQHKENVERLASQYLTDIESSTEQHLHNLVSQKKWSRILGWITLFLIGRWL